MKIKVFLITVLSLLLVTGCEAKKPNVCTTVYPVQYLIERIGGEYVKSTKISSNTMIQRSQIKKNYEKLLDEADALFYIGGLEPYMELYIDSIREVGVDMNNLATKSAIYKFQRYTSVTIDTKTTSSGSRYYEGEEFDNLDTYNADPMLWMDPVAMTSMASDVRDYLVTKYSEYEKIFNENYKELELDLARLEADFQTIPDEKMNISFVSITPSFGNWQKSYGVKVYPISLSKYGALPISNQLEAIKTRIKNDQVRFIAVEQNLPQDMIEMQNKLIDELGLIPVELHNLSSLTSKDQTESRDYLTIMYDNLKVLTSMAN